MKKAKKMGKKRFFLGILKNQGVLSKNEERRTKNEERRTKNDPSNDNMFWVSMSIGFFTKFIINKIPCYSKMVKQKSSHAAVQRFSRSTQRKRRTQSFLGFKALRHGGSLWLLCLHPY
jgi:hypothetical protein